MIDENFYVDSNTVYFNKPDADASIHIVRKGVFMEDENLEVEDILLTLCFKYMWDTTPEMGEFDDDWIDDWRETNGCEECFNTYIFITETKEEEDNVLE